MWTRSREGGEWSTMTFSLADDLPEGSGSPAKDSPWLHDGEVLQESGERGVSKWEGERVPERGWGVLF
jgi:hypothetical protein